MAEDGDAAATPAEGKSQPPQKPDSKPAAPNDDRSERNRYFEHFDDVLKEEHAAINRRRRVVGRKTYEERQDKRVANPEKVKVAGDTTKPVYETVGLALSGGGIRSASFCLGTLQALDQNLALGRVDYLSTVSGGGYIGASTVATMLSSPEFVYSPGGNIAGQRANAGPPGDRSDTTAVSHLRNHSRYLIPTGFQSLLQNFAILLRGWAASAFLVIGVMVAAAFFTLLFDPNEKALGSAAISIALGKDSILGNYLAVTKIALSLVVTYLIIWAIVRSILESSWVLERFSFVKGHQPDVPSRLTRAAQWLLIILGLLFLVEVQAVGVRAMRDLMGRDGGIYYGLVSVGYLALGAGLVIAFASSFLAGLVKQDSAHTSLTSLLRGASAKLALLSGAFLLPVAIYIGYLWLAAVGICNNESGKACHTVDAYSRFAPWWIRNAPNLGLPIEFSTWFASDETAKAPSAFRAWFARFDQPILQLYGIVGTLMLFLSWLLTPNANSLHSLYRDRLAKAFLFDPKSLTKPKVRDRKRDPDPLPPLKLSDLKNGQGPFPIINAALNIQGSAYLNRRGRNAEFFTFTPLRIGSEATGFAATPIFERALEPRLDLATAMAISGAAISSNMGKQTLKAFTLTLALLNLRLGYWLKNPRRLKPGWKANLRSKIKNSLYLLAEGLGRLDERGDGVYLTDGGHIENLGLYSLLRRRCELIVVVDSECDQGYAFESLIAAQRYARIDLGIRIFLPWEMVRDDARRVSEASGGRVLPHDYGPFGKHVAVGVIEYGPGVTGWLVYVKASLSGDEGDGILDYKRRNPVFPHETTGDQFFSEEQFEVYRALGYHIMNDFLEGAPVYATLTPAQLVKLGLPGADPQREVLSRLGL